MVNNQRQAPVFLAHYLIAILRRYQVSNGINKSLWSLLNINVWFIHRTTGKFEGSFPPRKLKAKIRKSESRNCFVNSNQKSTNQTSEIFTFYSVRRLSTGLALAALSVCDKMVARPKKSIITTLKNISINPMLML